MFAEFIAWLFADNRSKTQIGNDIIKNILFLILVIIFLPIVAIVGAIGLPFILIVGQIDEIISDIKKLCKNERNS